MRAAASHSFLRCPSSLSKPRALHLWDLSQRSSAIACKARSPPPSIPQAHPLGSLSSKAAALRRSVMAAAGGGGITVPTGQQLAVLGGGCFWCLEACYSQLKGVSSAISGYAGGHVDNPTYEQVCGKGTGHAEVVGVVYDPATVSFRDLLDVFFTIHDPTTPNRQGADVGPQYRSVIFYTDDTQKAEAQQAMADVQAAGIWPAPIVTELLPLPADGPGRFHAAEAYHQAYFANNPGQGYCRAVVAPKVSKFRAKFLAKLMA